MGERKVYRSFRFGVHLAAPRSPTETRRIWSRRIRSSGVSALGFALAAAFWADEGGAVFILSLLAAVASALVVVKGVVLLARLPPDGEHAGTDVEPRATSTALAIQAAVEEVAPLATEPPDAIRAALLAALTRRDVHLADAAVAKLAAAIAEGRLLRIEDGASR